MLHSNNSVRPRQKATYSREGRKGKAGMDVGNAIDASTLNWDTQLDDGFWRSLFCSSEIFLYSYGTLRMNDWGECRRASTSARETYLLPLNVQGYASFIGPIPLPASARSISISPPFSLPCLPQNFTHEITTASLTSSARPPSFYPSRIHPRSFSIHSFRRHSITYG
jgi:hypothetical protein